MSTKALFRGVLIVLLVGIIALLSFGLTPVYAQCENPQPSSCTTCHALKNPVSEKGEWHS